MKKIKLQPREKLIVSIAVLAVIGYGFYTFWFQPYSGKIAAAQGQIAGLQNQINQDKNLLSQQKNLNANSGNVDVKAQLLAGQLPTVAATPSVLADLQRVINSNGAVVNSMALNIGGSSTNGAAAGTAGATQTPKGLDPTLTAQSVAVSCTGSYAQIYGAIQTIENNQQRTYTISNLSINGDNGKLTGSMTVQIYFSKTPIPGYTYKPMLVTQGKSNPFAQ